MRNVLIALLLLTALASAQKSYSLRFYGDNDSLMAEGKWASSDTKQKTALEDTEIDCDRQLKMCIEATAEYSYGHPHVSLTYLDIVTWNGDQIIAVSSAICLNRTILISIPDKTISSTTSSKTVDKDKASACKFLGDRGTQTLEFVLKGSKRWNDEQ